MSKKAINVDGFTITIDQINKDSYISLTDIARRVDARTGQVLGNWLRNAGTLDFLFEWGNLYNKGFNVLKFEDISKQAAPAGQKF